MTRTIILAICLLLCPTALAETRSKTVRDWTGSCDDYSCKALVTGEGGLAMGQTGYQLEIARAAGGNEAWMVTLIAHNVAQPDGKAPVVFAVPDYDLPAAALAAMGEDRFTVSDQAALEAIFPALRKGSVLNMGFSSGSETHEQAFSLSGIAAVLLWIDEMQGQVGNSGKVLATSANSEAQVTGSAADNLREVLSRSSVVEDCQWNIPGEDTGSFDARSYDLGEGYSLHVVVCSLGAYQSSSLVFVSGSGGPRPVAFADYSDETGWSGTLNLGFVDFDPKTLILHNYVKFRGIGDCGTWSNMHGPAISSNFWSMPIRDVPTIRLMRTAKLSFRSSTRQSRSRSWLTFW